MEHFCKVRKENQSLINGLLREKRLFPKEMPESAMHNVGRCTKQILEEDVERFSVLGDESSQISESYLDRYPIWSDESPLISEDEVERLSVWIDGPSQIPSNESPRISEDELEGFLVRSHESLLIPEEDVERFPVWSNEFVDDLLRDDYCCNGIDNPRRNIKLVVPGLVPEGEYIKIKHSADKGNYEILNTREFPYYPKAVWFKVTHIEKLNWIWRQFPEQIILVEINVFIPYDKYELILAQSLAKGFIVLNPGPWVDDKDIHDSLFGLELHMTRKQINLLSEQQRYLENVYNVHGEWKERIDKRRRDRAHAKMMAAKKATVQSLDEKIALLHNKLNHYETMSHDVSRKYQEDLGNAYEEYFSLSHELHEEEHKMAKAEAALEGLREQLERRQTDLNYEIGRVRDATINCSMEETRDLQEKLQGSGTTLQFLHSNPRKPGLSLEPVMWSLSGISTSVGLSLFAVACLPLAAGYYNLSLRPLLKNSALLKFFNPKSL